MLKKLIRAVVTIIGIICGYCTYLLIKKIALLSGYNLDKLFSIYENIFIALSLVIIFAIFFYKLFPIFTRGGQKVANNLESDLRDTSANEIMLGTIGLLIGFLIALLVGRGIYAGIQVPLVEILLNIVTYVLLGLIGTIVATSKAKEFGNIIFGGRKNTNQGKSTSRGSRGDLSPKILDTSVIIDGRIADIMNTGFIEGPIVIPEFVLVELRHIADSSDSLKRQRGRRGLDILNSIQKTYGTEIYDTTSEKVLEEIPEVDVKLLKLAQITGGKVVTNDFNLNKVAAIKGVPVLNVNELANALRPAVLPGEGMIMKLVKEGKEKNQAVAYLDDGTMIVVEEGRPFIGQTIKVIVTSVLQTSAGRMIFAKPEGSINK